MKKKLIIISGPDRAGKSTLSEKLSKKIRLETGEIYKVIHHGIPSLNEYTFDMYRRSLQELLKSDCNQIWDRSYVCAYALEPFRRHTHDFIGDIMFLETTMVQLGIDVTHVLVNSTWNKVASRHIDELEVQKLSTPQQLEHLSKELLARSREHKHYLEKVSEFLTHHSLFPHIKIPSTTCVKYLMIDLGIAKL